MGPEVHIPPSGNATDDHIVSVTDQSYLPSGFFADSVKYCLIVTTKSIICVKTGDLLAAREKDASEKRIIVHKGFFGFLEKTFFTAPL